MNIFTKISRYVTSNISSNRFKYSIFTYSIALIHAIFIALFALLDVIPMVAFNICSVIAYLGCGHVVKYGYEKNIIYVFYFTYIEIILHALLATVCVGWNFGFPHYTIGLIPYGYYICVTVMNQKHKYAIATVMGIISYFVFISCRLITLAIGRIYDVNVSAAVESWIYIFNATCNFLFLFMVTIIFVADAQATNNKLHIQNAMLDNMASIDPLTGLYNRRSMHDFLDGASKSDKPFALIMCDIDNFKKVNDNYGHDFGDVVLKEIAAIIRNTVGENGSVCRWGGEEILILYNGSLDMTCKAAEAIRHGVETHIFTLHDKSIHVSITLGIATHRKDEPIEDTITHADSRLYYGKQNGKNQVVSPYDMA